MDVPDSSRDFRTQDMCAPASVAGWAHLAESAVDTAAVVAAGRLVSACLRATHTHSRQPGQGAGPGQAGSFGAHNTPCAVQAATHAAAHAVTKPDPAALRSAHHAESSTAHAQLHVAYTRDHASYAALPRRRQAASTLLMHTCPCVLLST